MIVAIHQPNFLPWTGYFHKLIRSDVFVLFDDVAFPRGKSYGNRASIKTSTGKLTLTIPVLSVGNQQLYSEVRVCNKSSWQRKTLRSIQLSYTKAPYFTSLFPMLAEVYSKPVEFLAEFNLRLIEWVCGELRRVDCQTPRLVLSSAVCGDRELCGEEKILFLLKELGATVYISGTGAGSRRYILEEDFERAGIRLVWQKFEHPTYPQWYEGFLKGLSILDMLFNCGATRTVETLKKVHARGTNAE